MLRSQGFSERFLHCRGQTLHPTTSSLIFRCGRRKGAAFAASRLRRARRLRRSGQEPDTTYRRAVAVCVVDRGAAPPRRAEHLVRRRRLSRGRHPHGLCERLSGRTASVGGADDRRSGHGSDLRRQRRRPVRPPDSRSASLLLPSPCASIPSQSCRRLSGGCRRRRTCRRRDRPLAVQADPPQETVRQRPHGCGRSRRRLVPPGGPAGQLWAGVAAGHFAARGRPGRPRRPGRSDRTPLDDSRRGGRRAQHPARASGIQRVGRRRWT